MHHRQQRWAGRRTAHPASDACGCSLQNQIRFFFFKFLL
jgi:hypothetical protein